MKKIFAVCLSGILLVVLMFGIGYYLGWDAGTADSPIIIEQEKIVYQPVQREYRFMKNQDLLRELKAYDTGIPTLKISTLGPRRIRADAGLNGRMWSREVTMKVGCSGNWNLYLGLSIGTAAGVGLTYGLVRLIK